MNDKELELVSKLSEVVAGSTGQVLDAYTWYYITASIVWLAFGIAALWGAYALRKHSAKAFEDETDGPAYVFGAWIVPAVLVLIAALTIASNLSDLTAPRAMAIHQLMQDIRGE
jgi:presenilin-like A22 family membrane protease